MADRLTVDYQVLEGSGSALDVIAGELEAAPRQRDVIAAAVGHRHLADAVREFADNWDRHRGKLIEDVRGLAGTLGSAALTFRTADADLGRSLVVQEATP